MIDVINKECCGDCTKCTLINEVPGFDFYGCVLNQMFQKMIRMENRISNLEKQEKRITIIDNDKNLIENETSSEKLPEQKGEK
jgi:hypothetical protein|uniref:hypothetical protein n=1 Tax=Phocaeicola coprocola TaxID=310298 RepID=UPI003FED5CE7